MINYSTWEEGDVSNVKTMDLKDIPTYQAGIAQAKAYRVLRSLMAELLKAHNLTMMQWSMLGLVYEAGSKGMRITDIAEAIDSTKAFITSSVKVLELRGFVTRTTDQLDTRSRIIQIKPQSKAMVEKVEIELRREMRRRMYAHISPVELATYVRVLDKIAQVEHI